MYRVQVMYTAAQTLRTVIGGSSDLRVEVLTV